ncbi:unnamed protein product [Urochloa humidicola]
MQPYANVHAMPKESVNSMLFCQRKLELPSYQNFAPKRLMSSNANPGVKVKEAEMSESTINTYPWWIRPFTHDGPGPIPNWKFKVVIRMVLWKQWFKGLSPDTRSNIKSGLISFALSTTLGGILWLFGALGSLVYSLIFESDDTPADLKEVLKRVDCLEDALEAKEAEKRKLTELLNTRDLEIKLLKLVLDDHIMEVVVSGLVLVAGYMEPSLVSALDPAEGDCMSYWRYN